MLTPLRAYYCSQILSPLCLSLLILKMGPVLSKLHSTRALSFHACLSAFPKTRYCSGPTR